MGIFKRMNSAVDLDLDLIAAVIEEVGKPLALRLISLNG